MLYEQTGLYFEINFNIKIAYIYVCTHTNFQKFVCWFVVIFSLVWCNHFIKSYISKCSQFCVEYDEK